MQAKTTIIPTQPITFGRYSVIQQLGSGAMGRVYLAKDPILDRQVALKVILVDKNINITSYEEYIARFTLEARASAKLNHPSIVTVFDTGNENGTPWIAFEYVQGESLDSLICKNKTFSLDEILHWGIDLASALDHAHQQHIVHRDIKPANILIDQTNGIAKLTDFGIAKAPWSVATQEGLVLGSPGYMSPEQIDGKAIDGRSDLFSLGIVLYELVTGKHPFKRENVPATFFAAMNESYDPIDNTRNNIPKTLIEIISDCLRADRDKRISLASELLKRLYTIKKQHADPQSYHTSTINLERPEVKPTKPIFNQFKIISSLQKFAENLRLLLNSTPLKWLGTFIGRILNFFKIILRALPIDLNYLSRSSTTSRLLVIGGSVLFLISIIIIFSSFQLSPLERDLKRYQFKGPLSSIIKKGCTYIDLNKTDSLDLLNDIFNRHPKGQPFRQILLFLSEVKNEDYDDALEILESIDMSKKDIPLLKVTYPYFFKFTKRELIQDEIENDLLNLFKEIPQIEHETTLHDFTKSREYWLRWNSVNVLQTLNAKVDMVPVYILDLEYGGSINTRIRAAKMLGQLKDKRAIPALKKASQKSFRNLFVAPVAESVLRNNF